MRTELQYNLQKARALATELRCCLEEIQACDDINVEDEMIDNGGYSGGTEHFSNAVGELETALDQFNTSVIGEGSVALSVEPFNV